jgi:hypothetical protein
MDTKLKADIAEYSVITALLKRGFKVLTPIGDRLPYDLAIDLGSRLIRIQVKSAWFDMSKHIYCVDARRTKTNRRCMKRDRYTTGDFDFAILYIDSLNVFYIIPFPVFNAYSSTICLVESGKRQRKPHSSRYRERWDLLSEGSSTGNG